MNLGVALLRVSTDKQFHHGDSLDTQKQRVDMIAKRDGADIVRYFTEHYSGRKTNRVVIDELLDFLDANSGEIKIVYIVQIDRFTRAGSDMYLFLKKQLYSRGVELRDTMGIIQKPINTLEHVGFEYDWSVTSPSRTAEVMQAEYANQEVNQILTRTIGQQIKLAQEGYQTRSADLGFRNVKITKPDGRKATIMEPLEPEATWIRTIFELRASGEWSDEHICERTNHMGFESRTMHRRNKQTGEVIGLTGRKPLSVKQLQRIIRKSIYCGIRVGKWTHGEVSRSLRYWLEFHKTATVKEALQAHKQAQFRHRLSKEKGLAPNSVRRVLADGKAALNWAWKRGEVDALPYIELVKAPRPEPKGRPLNVEEVVRLFETATSPHIKIFMAFMLGTAGRTGAVVELTYSQIDLTNNLIHLNPTGRQQNKKYRPTVRLPQQLREYVRLQQSKTPEGAVITYDGNEVTTVRRSWRNTKKKSELSGNVQTYSFRHTIARWLRQQSVPAWEVSAQLGHKAPEYSTTEIYAPFDPAYLTNSVEAIDEFLLEVAQHLGFKSMSGYLSTLDNGC